MKEAMPLQLPAGTGIDARGNVDEVFGNGLATFVEFAVRSAWAVRPPQLTTKEAAGPPGPAKTVIRTLEDMDPIEWRRLLVSGATGSPTATAANWSDIADDLGVERVFGFAALRDIVEYELYEVFVAISNCRVLDRYHRSFAGPGCLPRGPVTVQTGPGCGHPVAQP